MNFNISIFGPPLSGKSSLLTSIQRLGPPFTPAPAPAGSVALNMPAPSQSTLFFSDKRTLEPHVGVCVLRSMDCVSVELAASMLRVWRSDTPLIIVAAGEASTQLLSNAMLASSVAVAGAFAALAMPGTGSAEYASFAAFVVRLAAVLAGREGREAVDKLLIRQRRRFIHFVSCRGFPFPPTPASPALTLLSECVNGTLSVDSFANISSQEDSFASGYPLTAIAASSGVSPALLTVLAGEDGGRTDIFGRSPLAYAASHADMPALIALKDTNDKGALEAALATGAGPAFVQLLRGRHVSATARTLAAAGEAPSQLGSEVGACAHILHLYLRFTDNRELMAIRSLASITGISGRSTLSQAELSVLSDDQIADLAVLTACFDQVEAFRVLEAIVSARSPTTCANMTSVAAKWAAFTDAQNMLTSVATNLTPTQYSTLLRAAALGRATGTAGWLVRRPCKYDMIPAFMQSLALPKNPVLHVLAPFVVDGVTADHIISLVNYPGSYQRLQDVGVGSAQLGKSAVWRAAVDVNSFEQTFVAISASINKHSASCTQTLRTATLAAANANADRAMAAILEAAVVAGVSASEIYRRSLMPARTSQDLWTLICSAPSESQKFDVRHLMFLLDVFDGQDSCALLHRVITTHMLAPSLTTAPAEVVSTITGWPVVVRGAGLAALLASALTGSALLRPLLATADSAGGTLLHAAIALSPAPVAAAVITRLVSAGAPTDARDASGRTPLQLAVARGDDVVVTALIDTGAAAVHAKAGVPISNITQWPRGDGHMTAWILGAANVINKQDMQTVLARDEADRTLLHFVSGLSYHTVASLLTALGGAATTMVATRDAADRAPVDVAAASGRADLVALFIKFGADPRTVTECPANVAVVLGKPGATPSPAHLVQMPVEIVRKTLETLPVEDVRAVLVAAVAAGMPYIAALVLARMPAATLPHAPLSFVASVAGHLAAAEALGLAAAHVLTAAACAAQPAPGPAAELITCIGSSIKSAVSLSFTDSFVESAATAAPEVVNIAVRLGYVPKPWLIDSIANHSFSAALAVAKFYKFDLPTLLSPMSSTAFAARLAASPPELTRQVEHLGQDRTTVPGLVAAVADDAPALSALLSAYSVPDLCIYSSLPLPPLCVTVGAGAIKVVSMIDSAVRTRWNDKDPLGRTPLHVAALANNWIALDWLLEHHKCTEPRDDANRTPWDLTLWPSSPARVLAAAVLAAHGMCPSDALQMRDPLGRTLLHAAASVAGCADGRRLMQKLMSAGADGATSDVAGRLPGDYEYVSLTIYGSKQPSLLTMSRSHKVLLWAENCTTFFANAPRPPRTLTREGLAAATSALQLVYYVHHAFNPADAGSAAALAAEALKGQPSLVHTVLASICGGAHAFKVFDGGATALHIASANGLVETVQRLLQLGLDAKAQDGEGRTPLSVAATPAVYRALAPHSVLTPAAGATAPAAAACGLAPPSQMTAAGWPLATVALAGGDKQSCVDLLTAGYAVDAVDIYGHSVAEACLVAGVAPPGQLHPSVAAAAEYLLTWPYSTRDVSLTVCAQPSDACEANGSEVEGSEDDFSIVELTSQAKLNRDIYGRLPLHYAAMRHEITLAAPILRLQPLSALATDGDGVTPLAALGWPGPSPREAIKLAAAFIRAIGRRVIGSGLTISDRDYMGWNIIHHLAAIGDAVAVDALTGAPGVGTAVCATDRYGNTPLHVAMQSLSPAVAHSLILAGADVHATNAEGLTPLAVTGWPNNTTLAANVCAAVLVAHNALPDISGAKSSNLLHYAAAAAAPDVAQRLIILGFSPNQADAQLLTPLHSAAAAPGDHSEMIAVLLRAGASTAAVTASGQSALAMAVCAGSTEAIELLIDAGASVLQSSPSGDTPLHMAVRSGNNYARHEIVRILVSAAPLAIGRANTQGMSPIMIAARDGNATVVQILLEACRVAPAAAFVVDCDGNSALHHAVMARSPEVCRMLLAAAPGLAVLENRSGLAPLHATAVSPHNIAVLDAIIESAVERINARNSAGLTPLHCAARFGSVTSVRRLLSAGADPSLTDATGSTALDLARNDRIRALLTDAGGSSGGPTEAASAISEVAVSRLHIAATLILSS